MFRDRRGPLNRLRLLRRHFRRSGRGHNRSQNSSPESPSTSPSTFRESILGDNEDNIPEYAHIEDVTEPQNNASTTAEIHGQDEPELEPMPGYESESEDIHQQTGVDEPSPPAYTPSGQPPGYIASHYDTLLLRARRYEVLNFDYDYDSDFEDKDEDEYEYYDEYQDQDELSELGVQITDLDQPLTPDMTLRQYMLANANNPYDPVADPEGYGCIEAALRDLAAPGGERDGRVGVWYVARDQRVVVAPAAAAAASEEDGDGSGSG